MRLLDEAAAGGRGRIGVAAREETLAKCCSTVGIDLLLPICLLTLSERKNSVTIQPSTGGQMCKIV
jgi:hypothetical protein